jgi:hypothetical protein
MDSFAHLKTNSPMTSSMTSSNGGDRVKALRHQPSAPDLLLSKINRSSLQNFPKLTGNTRSYSTGKMNHLDNNYVDWNRVSAAMSATSTTSGRDKQQQQQQQQQQQRGIRRSNSFRESYKVSTDLAPGLAIF